MASHESDDASAGHGASDSRSRSTDTAQYFPPSPSSSLLKIPSQQAQKVRNEQPKMHDTSQRDSEEAKHLLQEKLREMKAARLRQRKGKEPMRLTQSSPAPRRSSGRDTDFDDLSASNQRETPGGGQGMGIRSMEDRVSALHKENFDLKFEVWHRRERQLKLEEQIEALQERMKNQNELVNTIDELSSELDKKDQALREAADMINELEEKNDRLMQERNAVKSIHAETSLYLNCRAGKTSGPDAASPKPQHFDDAAATLALDRTKPSPKLQSSVDTLTPERTSKPSPKPQPSVDVVTTPTLDRTLKPSLKPQSSAETPISERSSKPSPKPQHSAHAVAAPTPDRTSKRSVGSVALTPSPEKTEETKALYTPGPHDDPQHSAGVVTTPSLDRTPKQSLKPQYSASADAVVTPTPNRTSKQAVEFVAETPSPEKTEETRASYSPRDDPEYPAGTVTTPAPDRKPRKSVVFVARTPSFLSESSESLRNDSNITLPKLPRDDDSDGGSEMDDVDSLSMLSESSFLSVYGEKDNHVLRKLDLKHDQPSSKDTARRIKPSYVDKWLNEELNKADRQKLSGIRRTSGIIPGQSHTTNGIKSPLESFHALQRAIKSRSKPPADSRPFENTGDKTATDTSRPLSAKRNDSQRVSFERSDGQHGLPPTPETISTETLRQHNDDAVSTMSGHQAQSPDDGQQLNDTFPREVSMQPRVQRPSDAAEAITRFQNGHGLDTVTQGSVVETDSESEVEMPSPSRCASTARRHAPATCQPPKLLSFSAIHDEEWGHDHAIRRRSSDIPTRSVKQPATNSNLSSAATPAWRNERTASSIEMDNRRRTQMDAFVDFAPPQRRSSVAASPVADEKRLRRLQQAEVAAQEALAHSYPAIREAEKKPAQQVPEEEQPKRGFFKRFGFGRSASAVQPAPSKRPRDVDEKRTPPSDEEKIPHGNGRQSLGIDKDELKDILQQGLPDFSANSSATPPPIMRYPRGSARNVEFSRSSRGAGRPSTSHSTDTRPPVVVSGNAEMKRRLSTGSGGGQERHAARDAGSTKAKKWYALGKGSASRR